MKDLLETVEKHCGETDTYSVYVRREAWEGLRDTVVSKLENPRRIGKVFTKGLYKGYEVSVFENGRIVVSGVRDEEELVSVLSELFSF